MIMGLKKAVVEVTDMGRREILLYVEDGSSALIDDVHNHIIEPFKFYRIGRMSPVQTRSRVYGGW